jgi:hypothetical protein
MKDKSQLATFRIDPETWEAFKRKARQKGATASEELVKFVESYLEGDSIPVQPVSIESRLADIEIRLARLEEEKGEDLGELAA